MLINQTKSTLDIGIALLDDTGAVLYENANIKKWFSHTESIENQFKQFFPKHRISKILSSDQSVHWRIALESMELECQVHPYPCSIHPEQVLLLIAYDITPFKKIQEQLAEAKATRDELDAIIQNSYDAIYITDQNGITLKTNDAIERLTGIPKEYYIGKDLRYLEKRGIVQKSVTFEVMKQKKPVTVIQENALGKVILITGSPVFNEQGEIIRVVTNLRDISELNRLREELLQLRQFHAGDEPIVVASKEMKQIMELAKRVAQTDTTVLLLGESGVGKEVVARVIHRNSKRYEKGSFIKVNCGAIPQELQESELFGYESGAFTGARKNGKKGMFELAHEGTLFLDEVGEMPLHLQVKLLRVLQDQEFYRVGGTKPVKVNVRIIAATNRNLKNMVKEGKFREDLYYRLNVVPIEIPPLRKRPEDISPLIQFYLDKFNRKYQTNKKLNKETLEALKNYPWPGNIRELANLIERLLVIIPEHEIKPEQLPNLMGVNILAHKEKIQEPNQSQSIIDLDEIEQAGGLQAALEQLEQQILKKAYERYHSSYQVAKKLNISQSTAIRKAHKYGIHVNKKD
ncbi:sigma-54 interaction domain-containing protein [Thermoflavimicrobium dichotomicum]|uniref:HTH-type transcriptional regulatory protein TyrR n=1 Tax=Thermoflavimicrobium dichotomicum TaxID=46223 RepID=A0A1I3SCR0_9BACL|nr:sigma 54-interacting transcriptional regulator [Thermoflavimicrobium dichotomicum]SFJ55296.1 PAS domain S-box-containing protein/TyrR family helix-turn-helix domain-containing protein [Thermoflavimicrobium dichotomicum]